MSAVREPWRDRLLAGVRLIATVYVFTLGWLAAWLLLPSVVADLRPVVIVGGSMAPALNPGDVILIAPVGEPLTAGQVVTFSDPANADRLVTHRITAVEPDGSYRTRGDANAEPDSTPVPHADVEGVGRLAVPVVGLPVYWLGSGAAGRALLWAALTLVGLALAATGRGGQVRRRTEREAGVQHG